MRSDLPLTISKASVHFAQQGNTMGTTPDTEGITVEAEVQNFADPRPFFVLRTDGWSVDSIEDLRVLLATVESLWHAMKDEQKGSTDATQAED